ncbi:MAG: hypothetical protein M3384_12580 [Acidobacteriota bacterium]|nr:hypothetical protein [Acidobacteriota bacterium]
MTRYQTTDPNGYWFGRLITYDFNLDNLDGEKFNEDTFREDLENGDIVFHNYTLLKVSYEPQAMEDSAPVLASGEVELDFTMNESRRTTVSKFTFQINRGWLASSAALS